MKIHFFLVLFTFTGFIFGQESNYREKNIPIKDHFVGSLVLPNTESPPLVLLLAGSGPLDKDGNTNFMKGDMLKKLARIFGDNGIASFRYDKHSLRQIKKGKYDLDYTFEIFIEDARMAIAYFKSTNQFSKIYVLGHSQGSLVGMIAAQDGVDGFISLAGAGQSIDEVITYQINESAPQFTEDTKRVFGVLKEGKTTDDFPAALASIFNRQTQPFMINWMSYNPQKEIKKLDIPVLIINGTKDIQVTVDEARLLHTAYPESELVIIEKMNHVLVPIEGERLENVKSYNEPNREFSAQLITALLAFIK